MVKIWAQIQGRDHQLRYYPLFLSRIVKMMLVDHLKQLITDQDANRLAIGSEMDSIVEFLNSNEVRCNSIFFKRCTVGKIESLVLT